jgi:hypothetical protein
LEAVGADKDGNRVRICVKPQLTDLSSSVFMNVAELLGGVIGSQLGIPVAEVGLAFISDAFVASVRPTLNNVVPGWAVASRWIERSLPCVTASPSRRFTNPESVAGVTVLDTMLQNEDRADNNVLLEPAQGNRRSFTIRYIDHGWGLGGVTHLLSAGSDITSVTCCTPENSGLRALVTDQATFMPYLLAAEGLRPEEIATLALELLSLGWNVDRNYPSRVEEHLVAVVRHLRTVVLGNLSLFPRCR